MADESRIERAIRRIADERRPTGDALPARPPAQPIPVARGVGAPDSVPASSKSGIASPLTEPSYAARAFHPERTIKSSDGIFSLRVRPVASVRMHDATGAVVVLNFAAPPA